MKIGVIGAGQLGRMLALAGYPLAQQFLFLDTSADAPGAQVAPIITGAFDDPQSLERLAAEVDLVTYEFENVPVGALQRVAATRPVWPPVEALRVSQDRLLEKQLFTQLRIPTPAFRAVDSLVDLRAAVKELGLPCVLKTRRLGYDGKGQRYLRKPADIEPAWNALGSAPLILEGFVDFEREVSIVGVRSTDGEVRAYPIVANTHKEGILRVTLAPHRHPVLQKAAEIHLKRVLRHFEYAGVLTIEFFVRKGKLVANEMAPRVHNSGHWTIEGAATSQFENHVRAILGLPLGDTSPTGHSAMINFIGRMPDRDAILALPGVHWHDYGKEPRPGRKIGHCTVVASSAVERDRLVRKVMRKLPPR
jgi:5-(carboxyamino)imidazole ribonucleotide synthase